MDRVTESSRRNSLDIHINKTKLMVINRNNNQEDKLKINQKRVERVNKYSYLGTTMND